MSQVFVGQIITAGFNFAPRGFALCQGQTISIAQNTALFSLLGTTYGGNGVSTFQLPDLQGRVMAGQGNGAGLSPYQIGEKAGTANVSILISNMPSHTHTITGGLNAAGGTKATLQIPGANMLLGHSDDVAASPTSKPAIYCPAGTATTATIAGLNATAAPTGGGIPLGVLNPFLCINMSIALQGIFPSRN